MRADLQQRRDDVFGIARLGRDPIAAVIAFTTRCVAGEIGGVLGLRKSVLMGVYTKSSAVSPPTSSPSRIL